MCLSFGGFADVYQFAPVNPRPMLQSLYVSNDSFVALSRI